MKCGHEEEREEDLEEEKYEYEEELEDEPDYSSLIADAQDPAILLNLLEEIRSIPINELVRIINHPCANASIWQTIAENISITEKILDLQTNIDLRFLKIVAELATDDLLRYKIINYNNITIEILEILEHGTISQEMKLTFQALKKLYTNDSMISWQELYLLAANKHFYINTLNKIIEQKIKPNSNILLIYDIPEQTTLLKEPMLDNDSPLQVAAIGNNWNIGDQMIISDHRNIHRFIISDFDKNSIIHNKPYNTTANFVKKFQPGAEILRAKHIAFYIAKNDGYKSNIYSLYMDDFSSGINNYYTTSYRAEAILDNIENLWVQVLEFNNSAPLTQPKFINALGWIFNRYVLVNILLKTNNTTSKIFTTGIEVPNSPRL